ncbi:MAG TPA: NAD-dependent epimerase/dehydratase family protein [Sporichthyaceae bacterium]|jgi:UDP-glucose 4-epimerase|nr:NAD-dependent epimerase/dehydratase family protein [Sporichthyaceae bacterium]
MGRTVLVTGVAQPLGSRLVRRLNDEPGVDRVIGIDIVPPRTDLGRAEFVRADIRNPIIARVIGAAEVDTVVHMSVSRSGNGAASRSSVKEVNVIGTMQLLAACQKAPGLRRLIVKSTTAVYGSSFRDPAMFTESTEPVVAPRGGYAKDAVEVESYVRGFGRRRADVAVAVLRFANFMGPEVDSPLTRLFTMPIVATPLGHDPRLQFVHVDDGLEVLRRAVVGDHQGIFNVAGDGVLLLSQAARRAGRPTVALPAAALNGVGGMLRRAGVLNLSDELVEFLTHGRAVDTSRLWERFGFRPAYSTPRAFEEFLDARGRGPLTAERLAFAAEHALDAVRVVTQVVPHPRRPDLAAIGESVDE